MIKRANDYNGTSFIEIYQNCNIFNDNAFSNLTNKETKSDQLLRVEDGKPMIFGLNDDKGISMDGTTPKVVKIGKKLPISFFMGQSLVY